jgi:hypothetical protein
MYTEQLSQALSIAGAEIDPVGQSAGTVTTGGVDMSKFHRAIFVVMVGSVGAAGTVDAKLQTSPVSNFGSGVADVVGSNITQVTAGNKVVTLEMRADQVPAGARYVRLSVTVGANAVLIAALAVGGEAAEKPGSANDVTSVAQRLVV